MSGKIAGSAANVMMVPFNFEVPIFFTDATAFPPFLYSCTCAAPSRCTSARILVESAFTTDAPTPCKPPEYLYPSPPNLPPAWSVVIMVSSADTFVFWCLSTGIPRPLSATRTRLSGNNATSMSFANPPIASSRELSKISQIRWWSPSTPVVPMYIPGRRRTASSPSKTVISSAPYEPFFAFGVSSGAFFAVIYVTKRAPRALSKIPTSIPKNAQKCAFLCTSTPSKTSVFPSRP